MSQDATRAGFEAAVIERFKKSGYLEVEIRVECLRRSGDGYADSSIDAYWHFWQTSRTAIVVNLPEGEWMGQVEPEYGLNENKVRAAIEATGARVAS